MEFLLKFIVYKFVKDINKNLFIELIIIDFNLSMDFNEFIILV